MSVLDVFPGDVSEMNISSKNITGSLDFRRFTKLIKLDCSGNKITELNNLPNTLKNLFCDENNITQLDNLPELLEELNCGYNPIMRLDNLPNNLKILHLFH